MNNYLMLLEASTSASGKGSFQMIILMVLLFVGMYFLMIRPQKKQQKKEQEIRENTQVGDEITTIGGIVGKVVTVKEDSLIIETGADKNKMKITRWAIQTNVTANEKKPQRLPLLKLKKKRQKKRQIKRTKTENKRYKRIHPLIVIYEGVFLCVNKKIMFYRFGSKAL